MGKVERRPLAKSDKERWIKESESALINARRQRQRSQGVQNVFQHYTDKQKQIIEMKRRQEAEERQALAAEKRLRDQEAAIELHFARRREEVK